MTSSAPDHGPTDTSTDGCPLCHAILGTNHGMQCDVLAAVITDRTRPNPRTTVLPTDLATAGCGCPAPIVATRGIGHGHPIPGCLRATWLTPVDPPPASEETHTTTWAAAYADPNTSPLGIRPPAIPGGGYHLAHGFTTWTAAAAWLDRHTRTTRVRRLGVFLVTAAPGTVTRAHQPAHPKATPQVDHLPHIQ